MSVDGAAIAEEQYLRLLVMGPAKVGKTHCAFSSCEKRAYVIASDGQGGLQTVKGITTDYEAGFVDASDRTLLTQLDKALNEIETGVRAGKIKTVIWDTISAYASLIGDLYAPPDKETNWTTWKLIANRLRDPVRRLNRLPVHVILLAHSHVTQEAGKIKKIYPSFPGQAQREIPSLMNDVVYMEREGDQRVFRCSMSGVEGPGSRNLPGVTTIPADVMLFLRQRGAAQAAHAEANAAAAASAGVPASAPAQK